MLKYKLIIYIIFLDIYIIVKFEMTIYIYIIIRYFNINKLIIYDMELNIRTRT